jgi:hypothetical protein
MILDVHPGSQVRIFSHPPGYGYKGQKSTGSLIRIRNTGGNVQSYLKGVPLTPWAQMALLRRVSILTSAVPICFSANFLISCRHRDSQSEKNWNGETGGGTSRMAIASVM